MTEQEWLQSTYLPELLDAKNTRGSCRKYRLMAIACCRRIWHLLDEKLRAAVELAENFLERKATAKELKVCQDSFYDKSKFPGYTTQLGVVQSTCFPTNQIKFYAGNAVGAASWAQVDFLLSKRLDSKFDYETLREQLYLEETAYQLVLFRDIFGNPFRPVQIERVRQTSTIKAIAQTIYTERQFADLPILADALEEAGCNNEVILGHCRSNQEHVRGCWVIDLLLGKK